MPAKWDPATDRGLWAPSDPRLRNQAKMRKKCCYVWRRTWGQYSSLTPSQAHLSHTTSTLLRIKCERDIFYEEVCSFVHRSSSLCLIMLRIYLYMYTYSCIMAIQHEYFVFNSYFLVCIYPTPLLEQDVTQGNF